MNHLRPQRLLFPILLIAVLTSARTAVAQVPAGVTSPAPSAAPAAPKSDPLKRETPRDAIYGLLQACHQTDYARAAQYLNLKRIRADLRNTQGPDLARQLGIILDRDNQFEVVRLSDNPAGRNGDGLAGNLDKLNKINVNGRDITTYLQRENLNGQDLWLVSPESVLLIPQLSAVLEESPIEKKLPAPLVTTRLLGTALWVWFALLLAALLVAAFSRLLARLVLFIIRPAATRYSSKLHAHRLEAFVPPLRLILSVIVFRTCMEFIGPSALLRDALIKVLALLFIGAVAAILMGIVDVISDTITSRLDVRERAVSYSVLPLLVRSAKVVLGFLAILWILGAWGYNVDTILAGLGVGGIAVALAAQKTIENLFGGVSVISDKPVLVGDFCQFGGQVGTVEDIGLRSTRIRTLDRTVVTVPNSSFSTMTLENFSKRDRMWFHPTIYLRRDTPPDQIQEMMEAITTVLQGQSNVDPTDVPVRFTKITKESYDLEIFAYVNTPDFNEYLRTQTVLLLQIVEAAQKLKVEFAVPIQEAIPFSNRKGSATLTAFVPNASSNAPTTGE